MSHVRVHKYNDFKALEVHVHLGGLLEQRRKVLRVEAPSGAAQDAQEEVLQELDEEITAILNHIS